MLQNYKPFSFCSNGSRLKTSIFFLLFIFISLAYVLIAIGVHTKLSPEKSPKLEVEETSQRDSRSAKLVEKDESTFVDVKKLLPRPPPGFPKGFDPLAKLKGYNKNDPEIFKKMARIEAERQDLYLRNLRQRGALRDIPGGGLEIYSYPNARVFMPSGIKNKKVQNWLVRERVWANVTHFPWHQDEQCATFGTSFARVLETPDEFLKPTGLVSYPGSGNTWLRYLIEAITGYFSGSMYNDIAIRKSGYYGEGVPYDSGMTVVIKSHGFTTGKCLLNTSRIQQKQCNHMRELNKRAVLLIRNPFKAIISHRHLDSGGHKGFADQDQFLGEGWDYFVKIKIGSWQKLYLDWLEEANAEDLLVVFFEDLSSGNLENILSKISHFLGFSADEERLSCAIKHSEGKFHRKGDPKSKGHALNGDPFTMKQRGLIKSAILRVNKALVARGKDPLPLDKYEYLYGEISNGL